jgi:hypothetical protein
MARHLPGIRLWKPGEKISRKYLPDRVAKVSVVHIGFGETTRRGGDSHVKNGGAGFMLRARQWL